MKRISRLPLHLGLLFILGAGFSFGSSDTLHVAWLTDTHVGTERGAGDLTEVVNLINSLDIDQVLVSGDVTELDVGTNLVTAHDILNKLTMPYAIIPGNHDTKWSASGGQTFKNLFGSDRFNIELGPYRFIGIHQGPVMRMGPGFINPADLSWLDSILTNLPDPEQPVFIVNHYPMDSSVSNWSALAQTLSGHNIQALLHGHGHRNRVSEYAGIPGIMSRATISRGPQPAGFTLISLSADSVSFAEINLEIVQPREWHRMAIKLKPSPLPDISELAFESEGSTWSKVLGEMITAPPVVRGRRAVAGTSNGLVVAVNVNSGKETWRYRLGGGIHGQSLIIDKRLIVGTADSTLTCFKLRNGEILWQRKVPGPILSSPVSDGTRIFAGCGENSFMAFALEDGAMIWSFEGLSGFVETKPLLWEDQVLFGAWDGHFYVLNRVTGKLEWTWMGPSSGVLYSPAACWPSANASAVFFAAPDRALTAVSRTGDTLWRTKQHRVRETVALSEDGTIGFARCMWDTVFAFDARSPEPAIVWATNLDYGFDINPSMPVERGGYLWITAQNGSVYVLDSISGKLVWSTQLSVSSLHTAVAISKTAVLITGLDGILRRVNLPEEFDKGGR